jgi:hypothetical protein
VSEVKAVEVIVHEFQLFGVSWWPCKFAGPARFEMSVSEMGMSIVPTENWKRVRAEWWRWLGYHILKYPFWWFGR